MFALNNFKKITKKKENPMLLYAQLLDVTEILRDDTL